MHANGVKPVSHLPDGNVSVEFHGMHAQSTPRRAILLELFCQPRILPSDEYPHIVCIYMVLNLLVPCPSVPTKGSDKILINTSYIIVGQPRGRGDPRRRPTRKNALHWT